MTHSAFRSSEVCLHISSTLDGQLPETVDVSLNIGISNGQSTQYTRYCDWIHVTSSGVQDDPTPRTRLDPRLVLRRVTADKSEGSEEIW